MIRRASLLAIIALSIAALLPVTAHAWGGMKWLPNTCGADLTTARAESGSLWIRVTNLTDGKVLAESSRSRRSSTRPGRR